MCINTHAFPYSYTRSLSLDAHNALFSQDMDTDTRRVLYNIRKIAADRRAAPKPDTPSPTPFEASLMYTSPTTARTSGANFGSESCAPATALLHRDRARGGASNTQTYVYM